MAVEVEYIGGKSIGAGLPFLLPMSAAFSANLAATLPDIQARLVGALSASLSVTISPPSLVASAQLATQILAAINTAIMTPGVMVDLTAAAALIAELSAILGQIQANLTLAAGFGAMLGTAGIHFYKAEGAVGEMAPGYGGHLSGGIPGGSGPEQEGISFLLVAASPVSIAALKQLFGA